MMGREVYGGVDAPPVYERLTKLAHSALLCAGGVVETIGAIVQSGHSGSEASSEPYGFDTASDRLFASGTVVASKASQFAISSLSKIRSFYFEARTTWDGIGTIY